MFTRRFAASMVGTTLTAATLGLAALGFAGTASASSTDEAFLAQLQADGITLTCPTSMTPGSAMPLTAAISGYREASP